MKKEEKRLYLPSDVLLQFMEFDLTVFRYFPTKTLGFIMLSF